LNLVRFDGLVGWHWFSVFQECDVDALEAPSWCVPSYIEVFARTEEEKETHTESRPNERPVVRLVWLQAPLKVGQHAWCYWISPILSASAALKAAECQFYSRHVKEWVWETKVEMVVAHGSYS